jgi:hypothetical protein
MQAPNLLYFRRFLLQHEALSDWVQHQSGGVWGRIQGDPKSPKQGPPLPIEYHLWQQDVGIGGADKRRSDLVGLRLFHVNFAVFLLVSWGFQK